MKIVDSFQFHSLTIHPSAANFTNTTTTQLSCHVHNFIMIGTLKDQIGAHGCFHHILILEDKSFVKWARGDMGKLARTNLQQITLSIHRVNVFHWRWQIGQFEIALDDFKNVILSFFFNGNYFLQQWNMRLHACMHDIAKLLHFFQKKMHLLFRSIFFTICTFFYYMCNLVYSFVTWQVHKK